MSLLEDIRTDLFQTQPTEMARLLEQLPDHSLAEAVQDSPSSALIPVLDLLSVRTLRAVFRQMNAPQQAAVLAGASPRLVLIMLESLEEPAREQMINNLSAPLMREVRRLQDFPDNTAGRLMESPRETVRAEDRITDVLQTLKGSSLRRARSIYVVDEENRLSGRVDMQDIALADADWNIRDIMTDTTGSLPITATREEIVEQLDKLRVDAIPIVDHEMRLVGVVRYQRLFDVIENVATVDMQTMVGASADEQALSTPGFAVRRRLPWLHINLLTAFLAAAVVGLFENLIAQFTALAVLLPVVAGQSGNAGSQALAVTIRGLALREIGLADWRRVLNKEMVTGAVNGTALAFTCGFGVWLWSGSAGLMLVIAVAMVISMIAAGISGAVVPILLTWSGQDPATASSIILTTVTDVAGFFSFLGTATLLSFML